MYTFFYKDSIGNRHELNYQLNSYNSLMEMIFDLGLEDWGDCKGSAWCGTCHLKVSIIHLLTPPEKDESKRLSLLTNKSPESRLACQIQLTKEINNLTFEYIGDD